MMKILVVGDSMTFGAGLDLESWDPKLWINQLIANTFDNYELINLAEIGRNNNWIFTETAHKITQEDFDLVIVGWSELSRYNFHVGLELYSTRTMLNNMDININPELTVSGTWLEDTGNRLRRIYNDHWSILELVKYVNILYNVQTTIKNKKIFFVNTLSTWSDNYFENYDFLLPGELSEFQQYILQSDTRSDFEIKEIYNMIHQQYASYGGIKEHSWLNLYQSLKQLQVDNVSMIDHHPGYTSQEVFVKTLLPKLHEKLSNNN
jgi:hypothetical protein